MNDSTLKALREIGSKMHAAAGYTHRLIFTSTFTSGPLAGVTGDDQLYFCSGAACHEWVSVINAKNARGEVDYKVDHFKVEEMA